jgi:mono/diheme cytochrome c family protein
MNMRMKASRRPEWAVAAGFLMGFLLAQAGNAAADPALQRGEYLATIMDCSACHTDGALIGRPDLQHPLAGSSIGHEVPGLGVFYPPNLTPDDETGLGRWSRDEVMLAIRAGRRPDGRELAPAMPWRSYAALTDEDAMALASYLKSLPPTTSTAPAHVAPGGKPHHPFLRLTAPE